MGADQMLFRADGEVAAVNEETRTVRFRVSTECVDSYGTILRQDWDLEQYARNPIVFWNHNRDYPIGTALAEVVETLISPGVVERELFADVTFDAEDAQAVRIFGLVKRKVVRGISVGFRAKATTYVETPGGSIPVYSGNKLCELSVCGLPSNDDALARAAELSHQETSMADKTPVTEANAAPVADTISRSDHEGILRDTRNTHDTSIRAMQLTVDKAKADALAAEERAATAEKRVKDLDDDRLVRKLDSYVGKKIAPAERDAMLDAIRLSEPVFDRLMSTRGDLTGAPIVGAEDTTSARTSSASDAAVSKDSFEREVAKFVGQGMKRNDALAAATRSLASRKEASLCPFPRSSTPPAGVSRIRMQPRRASPLRWGKSLPLAPMTTPSQAPRRPAR